MEELEVKKEFICAGTGQVVKKPWIEQKEYGEKKVLKASVLLRFDGYGDHQDVFEFEFWDSAAGFIGKNVVEGDIIHFEAVPKNYYITPYKIKQTKFRCSTFEVIKYEDSSSQSVQPT